MINQLFLLGKIIGMPSKNVGENELLIEVKRNYKNTEGIFESDYFKCHLWIALSKKISLGCKVGDLVAVKGRLIEDAGICNILAEQIILLNKSN